MGRPFRGDRGGDRRRPFAELAWAYLQEDIHKLEAKCSSCTTAEDSIDPEAECENCPTRRKLDLFRPEFRAWMGYLLDVYDRMQGGWTVSNDQVSLDGWRALARIRMHYEQKRMEAMASAGLGATFR